MATGGVRGAGGRPVGYGRELVGLLTRLRAANGGPSFRMIARRIPSSAREGTSPGYLSEVFNGRRVPSGNMAAAIAKALRGDKTDQQQARWYAEAAAQDASSVGREDSPAAWR